MTPLSPTPASRQPSLADPRSALPRPRCTRTTDAGLYEALLGSRRAVLQLVCQRLHVQGAHRQGGTSRPPSRLPSPVEPPLDALCLASCSHRADASPWSTVRLAIVPRRRRPASPTAPTSSSSTRSASAPALPSTTPVRPWLLPAEAAPSIGGPERLLTDRPSLLGLSCDPSCSPDAASSVGRTAHAKIETLLCCLYYYVVLLALPAPAS
jgi:hypothetical protein